MRRVKTWFWSKTVTDLCMQYKRLDWGTEHAARMLAILLGPERK
jgi:hypothetical protein